MITYYFRTVKDEKLLECKDPRPGVWAHVVDPTEDDVTVLTAQFGLDASILNDARDFFEVPRFERSGSVAYFFTRYPYHDEEGREIDTAPILIAVGESFVATVALREAPFLGDFLSGIKQLHTTQKTKMFLELMSGLLESYNRELVKMNREVNKSKVKLRSIRTRDIERLVRYENALNDIVSALVPTNAWLAQVIAGNHLQFFKEDVALGEDLTITNNQLVDAAKMLLKTIQNIRSAYESILTGNLNVTIRMLTALTIILTIPTTIASLFGMNVTVPLHDNPYAFWIIIAITILSMLGVLHYFSKNRWL